MSHFDPARWRLHRSLWLFLHRANAMTPKWHRHGATARRRVQERQEASLHPVLMGQSWWKKAVATKNKGVTLLHLLGIMIICDNSRGTNQIQLVFHEMGNRVSFMALMRNGKLLYTWNWWVLATPPTWMRILIYSKCIKPFFGGWPSPNMGLYSLICSI